MWRSVLLALSTNGAVRSFATRNSLSRRIASRFVAGESVEEAVEVARDLTRRGATVEVDYLGESVRDRGAAVAARDAYLVLVRRLAEAGAEVHVSVKLTQMGIDVDEGLCMDSICAIAAMAEARGGFLWLDMEGSDYTERTLTAYSRLHSRYPNSGVALQAYLYRTESDLDRVLALGGTVRLCKGAYSEPASVAFPSKRDVDLNFARLAEKLLSSGSFQAIATHDEKMVNHVRRYAARAGIAPEAFEFQMLYGVRRDLQERLLRQGNGVRIYVPYGDEWYPYLMRRLAERPANLLFLLGNLVREGLSFGKRKPPSSAAAEPAAPPSHPRAGAASRRRPHHGNGV